MAIPRYPPIQWPRGGSVPTDAYMGVPVPESRPGPMPVDLYRQALAQYWQWILNSGGMLSSR